jgi:hypothetical protein
LWSFCHPKKKKPKKKVRQKKERKKLHSSKARRTTSPTSKSWREENFISLIAGRYLTSTGSHYGGSKNYPSLRKAIEKPSPGGGWREASLPGTKSAHKPLSLSLKENKTLSLKLILKASPN